MLSSAAVLMEIRAEAERDSGVSLKLFGFIAESVFTFIPESCSGSPRNSVRNHPGIAFTFPRIPQFSGMFLGRRISCCYTRWAWPNMGTGKVRLRRWHTISSDDSMPGSRRTQLRRKLHGGAWRSRLCGERDCTVSRNWWSRQSAGYIKMRSFFFGCRAFITLPAASSASLSVSCSQRRSTRHSAAAQSSLTLRSRSIFRFTFIIQYS